MTPSGFNCALRQRPPGPGQIRRRSKPGSPPARGAGSAVFSAPHSFVVAQCRLPLPRDPPRMRQTKPAANNTPAADCAPTAAVSLQQRAAAAPRVVCAASRFPRRDTPAGPGRSPRGIAPFLRCLCASTARIRCCPPGAIALRAFLDRAVLRFEARNIFAQRSPDAFRVARADDHAAQQLALRAIGEDVNKIQCELFRVVMNHHQIAVHSLQLFFVRLDLHLSRRTVCCCFSSMLFSRIPPPK